MKALLDTNVAMDFLSDRIPFSDDAEKVFTFCCSELVDGYFMAHSFCDLHYILNKCLHDEAMVRDVMGFWARFVSILETTADDCIKALNGAFGDYEDAVIANAAKRCGIDYIVTRNTKDFENSPVPAVTPREFIGIALKADLS